MTEKAAFRLPLLRAPLAAPSTGLELAAVGARPWVLAGPERPPPPPHCRAPRAPQLLAERTSNSQTARAASGWPSPPGFLRETRVTHRRLSRRCHRGFGRPCGAEAPRALSEGAPAGRAAPVFLPDNARMCGTTAFGSHSFEFRCLSQTEL